MVNPVVCCATDHNQGASFDTGLVQRILNATATEARIASAQFYVRSGGTNLGAVLSCDGGPSAAQASLARGAAGRRLLLLLSRVRP